MAKQDNYARYTIRVPQDVYSALEQAATAANRSVNAEIVQRLEQSLRDFEEVEDLWKQIDQRDATIRSIRDQAFEKEKLLTETLQRYEVMVKQQEALLRAVCYQVLMYEQAFPENIQILAKTLLEASGEGNVHFDELDRGVPEARYYYNLRKASEADSLLAAPKKQKKKA